MQVRAVEGIRVAEHAPRLFERDPVLDAVDRGLPPIPLEHGSVYTKSMARTSETSSPHTSMRQLLNESEMVGARAVGAPDAGVVAHKTRRGSAYYLGPRRGTLVW